jgi:hypothetical protein
MIGKDLDEKILLFEFGKMVWRTHENVLAEVVEKVPP